MGANILGPRKTRKVAGITGLDVVHVVVWSHNDSGRSALFTTSDHRHGVLHRPTGEWEVEDPQPANPDAWTCRQSSCHRLFNLDAKAGMRAVD